MSSTDQINIMFLSECANYLLPESETNPSIVLAPSLDIFVRVTPEQVTEETGVWHISRSHDPLDLVEGGELWGETAMHAEDFLIDDCGNRQAVKAVGESFPQLDIVSSLALIIEPIYSVNGSALVVSSQQEEVFGVFHLVGQQEAHGLHALLASVHIVPEEKVVGIGREAAILKESQQVVVLAMDVT